MSNGTPPIQPAPSPPSVPGIPQPVFSSGSATTPAPPIMITGAPILPPPVAGDPIGFPVFPPTGTNHTPVAVPVGPLVGPAVPPAPVPPSVAGIAQPVFKTGSATTPPGYFPSFTTTSPSPPIVFANLAMIGNNNPPPSTPGQSPPPINLGTIAPVNTLAPVVTNLGGGLLAINNGGWFPAIGNTFAYQWMRDGTNVTGATGSTYATSGPDKGHAISCAVKATNAYGSATAVSNAFAATLVASEEQAVELESSIEEARLDANEAPPPVRAPVYRAPHKPKKRR